MSREKSFLASGQQASPEAAKRIGATATVVAFVQPKRRGRPRKPPAVDRRCKDGFDMVAMAVAGIARQKDLWSAAKERLRRKADRDKGLRPVSTKVLGFQLEHINRALGYDWHAAGTIASELEVSVSAVEKAYRELTRGGYLLREHIALAGRGKGTRPWRTTIPALMPAAREVTEERERKARARLGLSSATNGPAQNMPVDPDKKTDGPRQEMRNGPGHLYGQTSKGESLKESGGAAADELDQVQKQPIDEPDVGKKGFQKEHVEGAPSRINVGAHGSGPKTPLEIPRLRSSPRFDQTLPMDLRLSIPGGRYVVSQTPDDKSLRRRMTRAARGHDLHDLLARYVKWAVSANTPDAVEGFIVWMWRFVQNPAVGYVNLGGAGASRGRHADS